MRIIRTISNFLWRWRSRCKQVRMDSSFFLTAGMAQKYLWDLKNAYHECRVCGERTCRWAEKRKTPRIISPDEQERHDQMMHNLSRR